MPDPRMSPEPLAALNSGIAGLFNTSHNYDMIVRCRTTDFKLHRAIIACQGGYFAGAVKDSFKEGEEGWIELSEKDEPEVIKAVLGYLYGILWTSPHGCAPAVFEAKVYNAGDYYQLPTVKARAKHNFHRIAYKSASLLIGAKDCFEAASDVYEGTPSTDRGLRVILVETTGTHVNALLDGVEHSSERQNTVKAMPEFALDLARWHGGIQKSPIKRDVDVALMCPIATCGLQFGVVASSNTVDYKWVHDRICFCPGCGKKGTTDDFFKAYRGVKGVAE